MKEITSSELKKLELDILIHVASFCEKQGIQYWIDYGTLLGAVRHHGFIPWDDDIDIAMRRDQYEQFASTFSDPNGRYVFKRFEDDPNYHYAFGKVLDTNTVLYEPNKKKGLKIAVYIDVFPYDNAPEDDGEFAKLIARRNQNIHLRRLQISEKHNGGKIRSCLVDIFGKILKIILPASILVRKQIELENKYRNVRTKYVCDLGGEGKTRLEKDWLHEFEDIEFEGRFFKAPKEYDKVLTAKYGDYMTLPPVDKRVPIHSFEAYYLDETGERQ